MRILKATVLRRWRHLQPGMIVSDTPGVLKSLEDQGVLKIIEAEPALVETKPRRKRKSNDSDA